MDIFTRHSLHRYRYKFSFVIFLLTIFLAADIKAQTGQLTISGKVSDENNQPIPGVSVREAGGQAGTQTNSEGNYVIVVGGGNITLSFSYLGFQTRDVPVNGRTTLNVSLQEQLNQLEDVVVVGYGVQKKESVVGAIAQIKGEALQQVGGTSTISESLQGLMPGLTVINSNGRPGTDNARMLIRGQSTFNGGAPPFVLVDGVERSLDQVDPNEIETISVLKDASATAVYGTRGANGVILITTKRGVKGKPEFSFTSNFGFKTPTVNQEYADYVTAMELYNEAAINDKLFSNQIPGSEIEAWRQNIGQAGPNNQYFPQVDWWEELVRDVGYQQNYNLNAKGGSDFMKYFVSLGYLDDGDIYRTEKNDRFDPSFSVERYNWRSNFDFDITKTTRFSVNFSGNFRYRNQPAYRIDGGGEDQFFRRMFAAPRNAFPLFHSDGFPGESASGEHNMVQALNQGGQRIFKSFQGFYDAQILQKLDFVTKGLNVRGKISYTSGSEYASSINREGAAGGRFSDLNVIRFYRLFDYTRPQVAADGSISYPLITQSRYPNDQTQEEPLVATPDTYNGYDRDLYYELSLNYARRFGDHDFGALLLFNRRSLISQGNSVGLGIGEFGEDYVGRITYGYKSRYLTEFNGSYTGSSKFAPGQRYGFFPSAAVGWIISDEPVLKNLIGDKILNLLKVRYNWGIVGSDRSVPANQFLQSFSLGGNVRFGDENFSTFGPLYAEGITANVNNTWETGTKQNFGIEFNLISKIRGTIDLFSESRTDILLQRLTIPRSFGNAPPFANIGETKNHGIEIDLGWDDKIGQDFRYRINATYAWSENRIVARDDARSLAQYLKQAGKPIGFAQRYLQTGYYNSLDDVYNYATPNVGTPQSGILPGDFLYADYNADGVIDQFDRVPMKYTTVPLQVATLTLGFNYKNFGFNMMFYGAFNVYKEVPDIFLWDFNNGFINGQPNISNRWTADNPMAAEKPTLHASIHRHNQNTASTYTYVNSTFVRLKNAEVSYRLSKQALKSIGLNSIQFYANGNNLFTVTDLNSRIDPETSGDNVYPVVRRFNLGLRANF